jgi:hypothetical protein
MPKSVLFYAQSFAFFGGFFLCYAIVQFRREASEIPVSAGM